VARIGIINGAIEHGLMVTDKSLQERHAVSHVGAAMVAGFAIDHEPALVSSDSSTATYVIQSMSPAPSGVSAELRLALAERPSARMRVRNASAQRRQASEWDQSRGGNILTGS